MPGYSPTHLSAARDPHPARPFPFRVTVTRPYARRTGA